MRPVEIAAVLLIVALALGGCTVKIGNPDASTPASSGGASGGSPPPAAGSGPQLVFLQVGDKYDAEAGEVTHKTDTFTPQTPVIEVNAGIKGLQTGAPITGTLTAIEVTTQDGTKIKDHQVATTDMAAPGEESTVHFSFSAPDAGWPKGAYRITIAVEGTTIETTEVTVK